MGWFVFFLAVGVGGILLWQNLQAITLIFFGGIVTVTLPVAVWVFLFILAGASGARILPFLYGLGLAPGRPRESGRIPAGPFPEPRLPRQPERSPVPPSPPASDDWELPRGGDEWNPRTPAGEPTPRTEPEVSLAEPSRVEPLSLPTAPARTPAVYSYSYRTARETRGEKEDRVYDANYRIVTPPSGEEKAGAPGEEEEEDWI